MRVHDTAIAGTHLIEVPRFDDERGHFAVMWAPHDFEPFGLVTELSQCNIAFNRRAGTIRGMHHQAPPFEQVKLVRCSRGAIFDVVMDLRPESPSYQKWFGVELTPDSNQILYAPKGVAHGYQTLVDDTEVVYLVSGPYKPTHERGVRWDDPAFGVRWPDPGVERIVNARDGSFPAFVPI